VDIEATTNTPQLPSSPGEGLQTPSGPVDQSTGQPENSRGQPPTYFQDATLLRAAPSAAAAIALEREVAAKSATAPDAASPATRSYAAGSATIAPSMDSIFDLNPASAAATPEGCTTSNAVTPQSTKLQRATRDTMPMQL